MPGQAHSSSPLSQSDEECSASSILRKIACTETSQTAPWSIYPTGNSGVEYTMDEAVAEQEKEHCPCSLSPHTLEEKLLESGRCGQEAGKVTVLDANSHPSHHIKCTHIRC